MVTTKGLQTKERIVRVAAELFYRKGYHAVGLNEVLATANAPKGSFYYYFQSKEELARDTIDYLGDVVLHRVKEALLEADGTNGREAVKRFVEVVARNAQDGETVGACPLSTLGMQLAASVPGLGERTDRYLGQLLAYLRAFLEAAERRGELLVQGASGLLAEEFLYLYEGSLVVSSVQGSTEPFRNAFDIFLATHFKEA